MNKTKQPEQQRNKVTELFVKFFYIFDRFSWFFGILITAIVLVGMYRFLIQPQYQKIVIKQAEIERLNLEGEKTRLKQHIERLNRFIELSNAITDDDKNHLDILLQDISDTLVLQIQLEKYFEKYDIENSSVTIGEAMYESDESESAVTARTRDSIIDLSGIFEGFQAEDVYQQPSQRQVKKIILGSIPITMILELKDYFAVKDFIRDLETIVPLIDMHSININILLPVTRAASEGREEKPIENIQENFAQIVLSGNIRIAKEQ